MICLNNSSCKAVEHMLTSRLQYVNNLWSGGQYEEQSPFGGELRRQCREISLSITHLASPPRGQRIRNVPILSWTLEIIGCCSFSGRHLHCYPSSWPVQFRCDQWHGN